MGSEFGSGSWGYLHITHPGIAGGGGGKSGGLGAGGCPNRTRAQHLQAEPAQSQLNQVYRRDVHVPAAGVQRHLQDTLSPTAVRSESRW